MGKILHICGPTWTEKAKVSVSDGAVIPTANGNRPVADLVGCTKSSLALSGANADGQVTYTSYYGGAYANTIQVAQGPGLTGAGNEDRPLQAIVTGMVVNVMFGTDGAGDTVVPTATEVADLVNALEEDFLVAAAGGDGTGSVDPHAFQYLFGGLDDGDRYKWDVSPPRVDIINLIETV